VASIDTLANVKTILGITDTMQDTQISALLAPVTDDIKLYCNNDFLVDDVETYPASLKLYFARAIADILTSGYAPSQSTSGTSFYSDKTLQGLNKWKLLHGVQGTITYKRYDKRGVNPPGYL
jgi:hypothetical protein